MTSISSIWRNAGPGHVTQMIDRFAKEAEAAVIQGPAIQIPQPSLAGRSGQDRASQDGLGQLVDLRV